MANPTFIYRYQDGSVVPASKLDHALVPKGVEVILTHHSFLDGHQLTDENRAEFYEQVGNNIANRVYPTTDHTFMCLTYGKYKFLYVSLDNSVRANQNGYSLKNRLPELCRAITKFIKVCGGEGVLFLSESCRPSFDGGMNEKSGMLSWSTIVRFIADTCNLSYLTEHPNNDTSNGMAFGISVFCIHDYNDKVYRALPRRITTEGIGSATIGITMDDGTMVWGVHFPIDFKGEGDQNLGAKAMVGLSNLMDAHPGSVAFGDFNTIHGEIEESVMSAIPANKYLIGDDITFLGAFYDTVKNDETWVALIE